MVFSSILISLIVITFLIVLYHQSLKKVSLENKKFSQLCQSRHEALVKYKQAKEMKLYGAMGYNAHNMVIIDKEISKRHFLYQKHPSILLRSNAQFNILR